jgi:hypothetical protein
MSRTLIASIFLLTVLAHAAAQTDEQRSTLADQTQVAVTIYNENLALVKDQRKLQLKTGPRGAGVSRRQRAHASRDRSAAQHQRAGQPVRAGTKLRLRSAHAPKAAGKVCQPQRVSIVRTNPATGAETTEQALVLSANNGVVHENGSTHRNRHVPTPASCTAMCHPTCATGPTLVMSLDNTSAAHSKTWN